MRATQWRQGKDVGFLHNEVVEMVVLRERQRCGCASTTDIKLGHAMSARWADNPFVMQCDPGTTVLKWCASLRKMNWWLGCTLQKAGGDNVSFSMLNLIFETSTISSAKTSVPSRGIASKTNFRHVPANTRDRMNLRMGLSVGCR